MTKIYGASDDLIEVEGDYKGEHGSYDKTTMLICSDGTLLTIKYGKENLGIWQITIIQKGKLFKDLEICDNPDADIYSDICYLNEGIKWIYAAREYSLIE